MPEEDALLEEIISKINERFDGIFSEGDRVIVETLYNRAKENKKLNRQAQKNDEEVYFPEVFKQVAQDCYIEQMKAFSKLFEDKRFYDTVMATLAQETYRHSIATTDITPVGLNFKAGKAYSKAQFDNIKIYTVKISDE